MVLPLLPPYQLLLTSTLSTIISTWLQSPPSPEEDSLRMSRGWASPGPCSGRSAPLGTRRAQRSGWLKASRPLAALSPLCFPKPLPMPSLPFRATPASIAQTRSVISSRRIRTASTAPVLGVPMRAHILLIFRFRMRETWHSLQLLTVTKLTSQASGSPNVSKCIRDPVVQQSGFLLWNKWSALPT